MIDTHCHLWDSKYDREDIADVVSRAHEAGVAKMLCLGCNRESSEQSIRFAQRFPGVVYAAVGTHPSDVREFHDDTLVLYRDLIGEQLELVRAVGEIGLDYHYPHANVERQHLVFRELIGLARSVSLPVVVHCRDQPGKQDASIDALSLLDDSGISQVVYHCYSGSLSYAKQLIERGFFLSFTGVITYPSAGDLRNVVKAMPLSRMMIETDSPYLAPQSVRGQRNEPAYVGEVAKCIAQVKGLSVEEVEEVTSANASGFFGL